MTDPVARFLAWQAAARAGDRFEYHRGFLAVDCVPHSWRPNNVAATSAIRNAVVSAYLTGDYELAQVRVDYPTFSYLIIKRRIRATGRGVWFRVGHSADYKADQPHRRRVDRLRRAA